jgi:outer membrane protein OmpA-like peptidoglycan-associated protein
MAKPLPKPSHRTDPANEGVRASRTPTGVWVIVGMAVFFVIGGLGISAFVVWKAIGHHAPEPVPMPRESTIEKAHPMSSSSGLSAGEVGVEHPSPNPMIDDAGTPPPVVNDRAEEDRMRQEVLKRIDLMRALTDGDKDKLYVQVERARGFTKIAIIPFPQNRSIAGAAQVAGLIKSLNRPDLQKLLSDPTVVLIVVGYADKKGDEDRNLDISRSRAESVVKALKEKTDLVNLTHAVGMGGQELFDQSNPEKNRVAEVWAVQP